MREQRLEGVEGIKERNWDTGSGSQVRLKGAEVKGCKGIEEHTRCFSSEVGSSDSESQAKFEGERRSRRERREQRIVFVGERPARAGWLLAGTQVTGQRGVPVENSLFPSVPMHFAQKGAKGTKNLKGTKGSKSVTATPTQRVTGQVEGGQKSKGAKGTKNATRFPV